MTTHVRSGFDAEALRRGVEERDVEAILSLYAEDAELRLVDRAHPPSSPLELIGKAAIAAYYRDISSRDMTHRLERLVLSDGGAAFTEACEYPDGTRVSAPRCSSCATARSFTRSACRPGTSRRRGENRSP